MSIRLMIFIVALLILDLKPISGQDPEPKWWPQFRGPNALGVADDMAYPDTLDLDENLLWRTEITSGVFFALCLARSSLSHGDGPRAGQA